MGFGSPLTRYAIIRPAKGKSGKYYLCWTTHHAMCDGWSRSLLLRQVDQQYRSIRSEILLKESPKEPSSLPLRFNKFIKALQEVDIHGSESFWREQFKDGELKTFPNFQLGSLCLPNASLESNVRISRESDSGLTISTVIRGA